MNREMEKIREAMEALRVGLHKDDSYSYAWHSNIAMMCSDAIIYHLDNVHGVIGEGDNHEAALLIGNDAASRFMKSCFGVETSQDMLLKPDEVDS